MNKVWEEDINNLYSDFKEKEDRILFLQQELQRKDNIINEIKRHLENEIAEWQDVAGEWTKAQVQEDKIILSKIKELEGKNE